MSMTDYNDELAIACAYCGAARAGEAEAWDDMVERSRAYVPPASTAKPGLLRKELYEIACELMAYQSAHRGRLIEIAQRLLVEDDK